LWSFLKQAARAWPNPAKWHMNLLALVSNPAIDTLRFQRDIQEWLRYLERMSLAYPLRFAAAVGLIFLICGLLAIELAAGAARDQPRDLMVAELRARRRQAMLISLFCISGIALGVLFGRFTVLSHPAAPEQGVPSPSSSLDQVEVWEDPHHGVYHCPGSGWFGKTRGGRVATLRQAQYDGYRPYARPCHLNQTTKESSQH